MKSTPPRLEPGDVHIWCSTLAPDSTELTRLAGFLSTDERIRAEALRDRQRRDRFVAGRGILRETVSRYLGISPEQVPLATGEHGKPHLGELPGRSGPLLRFNLSHAGHLLLLALSGDHELGVDVEMIQDDLPFLDMTKLLCSGVEREQLMGLPAHQQRAAFYRCWTRKEACLKGWGTGFTLPADSFSVSLLPGVAPQIFLSESTCAAGSGHWSLLDLSVPDGYYGALAVEGDAPSVRYCT